MPSKRQPRPQAELRGANLQIKDRRVADRPRLRLWHAAGPALGVVVACERLGFALLGLRTSRFKFLARTLHVFCPALSDPS